MRELISADAERFYQLNADPEVIRYTGDAAFADVEAARDFLRGYDHYAKYGFGRWAVIRREDGEFLGWCGIKYTPGVDEYDIGFRFFRACWGRGYATEAAKACLDYGLSHLRIETMVGRAMKANTASVKVLEKIGMVYWKSMDFHGGEGVVYKTP
ncbi:GNAT family N-acetyltransferase [Comamonas sp. JC664]|uniref:GNAT family N-acetyltransferase n=1 Tax=Comamonas sp. JC664 TaxID=2801917 RepID=UPI00174E2C43|nr:GNAT family N-acetyltransferase [Comamonas sp. JC664]MBL0693910.1 GNAT family N-acetyltransferase [Comamonas sp. JC664]